MKKISASILVSGLWLNTHEFLRNELLFKDQWVESFQVLGLSFPSAPLNGLVWVLWGFIFATVLTMLTQKLSLLQASLLAWFQGFGLMWIACLNLGVFPVELLPVAIPWSLVEVYTAAMIAHKILSK